MPIPATSDAPVSGTMPGVSLCRVADAAPIAPQDKRCLFDRYWQTRCLTTTDHRTRLRTALVQTMLSRRDGRLLDVGCGRGSVAAHFAEVGFDVTAIDISPMAVEWTRRQHPAIRTAVVDLENDPIAGSFDTIVCLEVLQQVREPVSVLKNLTDALAPGGELIVSLPNEFHLARRLSILFGRVDFGGIDDTHIKRFTPSEHVRLFDACGLRVHEYRAQSFIPPRWWGGRLHALANRVADRWPSMFALSVVYRLLPIAQEIGSIAGTHDPHLADPGNGARPLPARERGQTIPPLPSGERVG
ncbi:MAG: class I SAM-dependent methyltransferase [candidate division Zixibacteria bacterium]|nr:class I SAM-dependent methyltransferase [candidate division Zixibacteria bacterium]